MSGALSIFKRKVSLALKIETLAKIDKRAELDGTSRVAVVEYILSSALERIKLSPEEYLAIQEEVEKNSKKRKRKRRIVQ
jgi:hypothetical protein